MWASTSERLVAKYLARSACAAELPRPPCCWGCLLDRLCRPRIWKGASGPAADQSILTFWVATNSDLCILNLPWRGLAAALRFERGLGTTPNRTLFNECVGLDGRNGWRRTAAEARR